MVSEPSFLSVCGLCVCLAFVVFSGRVWMSFKSNQVLMVLSVCPVIWHPLV